VSERAFTEVIGPLVQPAFRLACAMLHDRTAAEDAVQEASLRAWRKLDRLDDATNLRSWYLGIVANECRNARRKRWLTRVGTGLPRGASVASHEERSVRSEDLRRALHRLRHEDRLVIALYFYLDMPVDEVAAVIGTSADAARRRLYRAIHRLRPDIAVQEALE
jgi:RNA polymerase sigma-70 factor (ECF subfamily)